MGRPTLLITCEHGGNRIPARYRPLFRNHRRVLESHRGYDPGALACARDFASEFDAELIYSTTSRLLVELNRSPHHLQVFSEFTRTLSDGERERILQRYYKPYRERVEDYVAAAVNRGDRVLHVSCHSFTPRLNGTVRRADIGLLYDPKRPAEAHFCRTWREALARLAPKWRVRRNYPYRGSADGLTTHLRTRFADASYCGIEIEVSQKYSRAEPATWRAVRRVLVASLRDMLSHAAR